MGRHVPFSVALGRKSLCATATDHRLLLSNLHAVWDINSQLTVVLLGQIAARSHSLPNSS